MSADLRLRPTVIADRPVKDDYQVIYDELAIGRIFKQVDVGGGSTWSWSCFLPNVPQGSQHRGREPSLDAAKSSFLSAWGDLQTDISYDQIREARTIQADRSRPWHRR